jgi:hypothetical protein
MTLAAAAVSCGLAAGFALAQAAAPARAAGQYTMVGGRTEGATAKVVYIIDSQNKELLAVRWNQGQNRLDGIGYRSIAQDADAQGRSR